MRGIGGATVEALWERGWLPNPAGLYKLTHVGLLRRGLHESLRKSLHQRLA
jgi:NAD-dependent DNA ligase